MTDSLLRIVAIGPESTGKSSLCQSLARHYEGTWCPEYAREFLLRHGRDYSYDDLLEIAKGQLALEDRYADEAIRHWQGHRRTPRPLLFIDTDMYVMKVWCEFVFGNCHSWILERIAERRYDLYLLCHTDLPWVQDELREYPDPETRVKLFHIYHNTLIHQHVPWADVAGLHEERLMSAIAAVDAQLTHANT
ncbi:MAG: ATPase [Chitinophagia bacterium]|nr:ATPase [Chitinophagia bacterium]